MGIRGTRQCGMDRARGRVELRRRDVLRAGVAGAGARASVGCATSSSAPQRDWVAQLSGSTLALLGEVHDNPEHHRLRAAALRQAFDGGWRPAIVMEQFDLDRQSDIDRARGERPGDAAYLIAQASGRGWRWSDYQAFVELALQYQLPLLAGNLPRTTTSRLARDDYASVLGATQLRDWRLADAPDAAWQAAQEREIDLGHCGALPQRMWAALARGQFARDAAMAHLLSQHASSGA